MMIGTLLAGIALASAAPQETAVLRTGEGALLEVRIEKPPGRARVPSIVLCPGREADRTGPWVAGTAERALGIGTLALTFDWHFTVVGSRPSVGYEVERDTLETVVRHLRIHPRSDGRVILAGAGLGAIVAAQAFQSDARLTGLVMVDPPPMRPREAEAMLEALDTIPRPILLLSSERSWIDSPVRRVRLASLEPQDDRIHATIRAVGDVLTGSGADVGDGT